MLLVGPVVPMTDEAGPDGPTGPEGGPAGPAVICAAAVDGTFVGPGGTTA